MGGSRAPAAYEIVSLVDTIMSVADDAFRLSKIAVLTTLGNNDAGLS
jgi:hypothetical protein